MLRTLTFIAMRQKADETRHSEPLAFTRRDELIEHDLRTVGEIAELGFPENQCTRIGQRIAVFVAEHRFFRKHRVDGFVDRLPLLNVVQRNIAVLGFLIIENRVALREGAAFHVLTGQADRASFGNQRTECQRFSRCPIDAFAGIDHLGAVIEEALDRAMDVEVLRNFNELFADFLERLDRNAGLAAALFVGIVCRTQTTPRTVKPVSLVRLIALACFEFLLKLFAPVSLHLVDIRLCKQTFSHQLVAVKLHSGLVRADFLIHQRLGE
ncbi:hypothetical protein D3C80_509010 [compost metagenome]